MQGDTFWLGFEENKLGRKHAVKYKGYKNYHFSGVPGTDVLGAVYTFSPQPRVVLKYLMTRKA